MSVDLHQTVLTRLLQEVSWMGSQVKLLRQGGRGQENVLTAEVLQGLDFLPRSHFLGTVLHKACETGSEAKLQLINEVEEAELVLFPGPMYLKGILTQQVQVQPDGILCSPSVYALVEAKRIGVSSFLPEQLARELLLARQNSRGRKPLLLLLLGEAPPLQIKGYGRISIQQAIQIGLNGISEKLGTLPALDWEQLISSSVVWTTWEKIADVVEQQLFIYSGESPSTNATIRRLAKSIITSVAWHSSAVNKSSSNMSLEAISPYQP